MQCVICPLELMASDECIQNKVNSLHRERENAIGLQNSLPWKKVISKDYNWFPKLSKLMKCR